MNKIIIFMGLFLITTKLVIADDNIKVNVGTQTYLCQITTQLECKAVNQIQQKEITLKKNSGKIQIEDKERNLAADIATSLDNNNIVYDITLCSSQSCSLSTITSDTTGRINQVMSGQYNINEKSFYVLGFFINNHGTNINFEQKILTKIANLNSNLH